VSIVFPHKFSLFNRRSFKKLLLFFLAGALNLGGSAYALASDKSHAQLAENPTWTALLQLKNGSPQIEDSKFYVNGAFKNSIEELNSLLEALEGPESQSTACRFPARSLWLSQQIDSLKVNLKPCAAYQEFLLRAPMDQVAVVFASENISEPSSMMGHIFFRLSGVNHNRVAVDHSISFFTEIEGWNFAKLFFQSLVTGKKGHYQLAPYAPLKAHYLLREQRNIWEYNLSLPLDKKEILHAYFFELKTTSFTYFFRSFNCATLVRNILLVAYTDLHGQSLLWVTPLDIVRTASQQAPMDSVQLSPASRWKIKALYEKINLPRPLIRQLMKNQFERMDVRELPPTKQFLTFELADAINDYQYEKSQIGEDQWRASRKTLKVLKSALQPEGKLDVSNYKSPAKTIKDSQVFSRWRNYGGESSLILGFLPFSHQLFDDTTQYQGESELRVGEISAEYNPYDGRLNLNSFIVYSALSLQPHDPFTGGLSGLLRLGVEPKLQTNLSYERSAFIRGGLGKTFRLLPDVDVAFLALAEAQSAASTPLSLAPTIEIVMRQIYNMKLHMQAGQEFRSHRPALITLSAAQVFNLGDYALALEYWQNRNALDDRRVEGLQFSLKRFF